jgi:hypothetical protein
MEHRLAAAVVWHRGDWDEVRRPSEHALDVFGRHRFARGIAQAQGTLAMAGRLWGAAAAADERRGGELTEHSQTRPLRESTESVVVDAEAEGRALDLWDAVDLALGEARQTVP